MQFSIPLYDALIGVNVASEKAKTVVDAFEKEYDNMTSSLATKDDLRSVKDELRVLGDQLHADMALLESRMTIKLSAMLAAAIGIVVTLMKVL